MIILRLMWEESEIAKNPGYVKQIVLYDPSVLYHWDEKGQFCHFKEVFTMTSAQERWRQVVEVEDLTERLEAGKPESY